MSEKPVPTDLDRHEARSELSWWVSAIDLARQRLSERTDRGRVWVQQVDTLNAVMALHGARIAATRVIRVGGDPGRILKRGLAAFDAAHPSVVKLRHAFAHFNEYLLVHAGHADDDDWDHTRSQEWWDVGTDIEFSWGGHTLWLRETITAFVGVHDLYIEWWLADADRRRRERLSSETAPGSTAPLA